MELSSIIISLPQFMPVLCPKVYVYEFKNKGILKSIS